MHLLPSSITTLRALLVLAGMGTANAQTPPAEPKPAFKIGEYRVLGNSVLPSIDIERVLLPRLGSSKSIDDVEQARLALETYYHDQGYGTVFVDIPEQDVEEGIVRLKVTEGVLARTRVVGAKYFSGRKILAALPAAAPNTVPHVPTIQSELAQLNTRTADRSVVPVLKAGQSPGTVDLALNVQDELPAHATLEFNNAYTTSTSKLRGIAAISYDNLFDRLDSISMQYQFSPQERSEVSVWAGSYTARLTDAGLRMSFFYVDSDSNVATVGDGGSSVDVLGKGKIFGARLIGPLVSTAAASHTLIAGIEYKDFTESVFSEDLVLTPISYANLSVGHLSSWRGEARNWSLANTANFGIRGAANDVDEFRIKRYRGAPNYFLVRSDGSFNTQLPAGLTLTWTAAAQFAVDSIISNEQFSIAGSDGVRGYLEAETLGDVGIKSSIELGSPRWNLFQERFGGNVFVFYDYGHMSRNNPLRVSDQSDPDYGMLLEPSGVTLRSAGVGLNIAAFHTMTGSLIWAHALANTPDATGTRDGDSRIHFNVRASW